MELALDHHLELRFSGFTTPVGALFIHFRSIYMDTTTLIQENIPFRPGHTGLFPSSPRPGSTCPRRRLVVLSASYSRRAPMSPSPSTTKGLRVPATPEKVTSRERLINLVLSPNGQAFARTGESPVSVTHEDTSNDRMVPFALKGMLKC